MTKNNLCLLTLGAILTSSTIYSESQWIGYDKAYHPRTEGIQGPITLQHIAQKLPFHPTILFSGTKQQERDINATWLNKTLLAVSPNNLTPTHLKSQNIKNVDLLWLDTNGSELQHLERLEPLLNTVRFIYTKVYLIEKDEQCPLYQSIRKFLEYKGFRALREDLPWNDAGYVLFQQKHAPNPYASQPALQQDKKLNECFFKNMRNGFFVDIGAHDGVSHSNTYFFEKHLGWDGICFEPLPNAYRQLRKTRDCTCINACVSQAEGDVEFIEVTGGPEMLSGMVHTYDPRHFERMKREITRDGGQFNIITIPSVNFNNIMHDHNVTTIDFMSIDTEGSELEILKSINFNEFNIHVITIENNYKDPAIRNYMESQGFTFVPVFSGQDEVYVNPTFK